MKIKIDIIERNWANPEEKSYQAISFSVVGKTRGELLLVEDKIYDKTYDYHLVSGEELSDQEIMFLVKAAVCFIQPGYYLTSCGLGGEQKRRLYRFFQYNQELEEVTTSVRVVDGLVIGTLRKKSDDNLEKAKRISITNL